MGVGTWITKCFTHSVEGLVDGEKERADVGKGYVRAFHSFAKTVRPSSSSL
jgi:hypothetical protein